MTFKQFKSLFLAKHPDGECFRMQVGGTFNAERICIRFHPDGKLYQYRPPFLGTALQLQLIEKQAA